MHLVPHWLALIGLADLSPHVPPPISLPEAGGHYIDPIFHTKIIRVTDSRHGARCYHAYSYWPALNADNTRLLLACDGEVCVFRFDPRTDTVAEGDPLGIKIQFEGATWSHRDPEVLFALERDGTRLWQIAVGPRQPRLLKDFARDLLPGQKPAQLSVSEDADVFSFHLRPSGEAVVWVKSTDRIFRTSAALDESFVDKAGQRVLLRHTDHSFTLWDFRRGRSEWFSRQKETDNANGHYDLGRRFLVNGDGFHTGVLIRSYDAPHTTRNVVQYRRPGEKLDWDISEHVSLRQDAETFVVVSTYGGRGDFQAFEDEIFLAHTDGSGVLRLAHTRSCEASADPAWRYYAQPRAVVDRFGKYIVYTSDLGSSDRLDVMILKVP